MDDQAESRVSRFYNGPGWEATDGVTEDARRFEDLRPHAQAYVRGCRLRVLRHIPPRGEHLLDMASGPIQYPEYLEYSRGYRKRWCVDLSAKALEEARRRIGDHGEFLCGDFLDLDLEDSFFDCTVSLHTIYHIREDRQEEAVRKLLRVTKPGRPVIVVYANPDTLLDRAMRPVRKVRRRLGRAPVPAQDSLYYFAHPLSWWERFRNVADIRFEPFRALDSGHQGRLVPDNRAGERLLRGIAALEERLPGLFVRHFHYPMVILVRRV
jgi:SAM-dependent methyltransferase